MKHVVGIFLALAAAGCSKGGNMTPGGSTCRSISDPEPGTGMMMTNPLPKALYAELRHQESGTVLPIMLDGVGGNYSGQTRAIDKCDPPGTYYVERLALIDAAGGAVATAVRSGSSYVITYKNGSTTSVSASSFSRYYASYSAASSTTAPTLMSVSPSATSARQGDRITITAAAMAPADDCGMRDMQWFLSPSTSPGSMTSPAATVTIMGGSGSGELRIPAELAATSYVLEGRLTSKTGRYALVRRQTSTDSTYSIYNSAAGTYTTTSMPLVRITVTDNPNADRTVPQPVSMEAMPAKVNRCQQVSFGLKVSDDQGLPATQEVKLRVGPLSSPGLLRTTLMGGGTSYSGLFTVPIDAPSGIWVAYPESIMDAAGNIGSGSLSADKFTISGSGISTPTAVQAATFLVEVPGGDTPPDMGFTPPDLSGSIVDLRSPEGPAMITEINVTPISAIVDMPVTVTVTWTGAGLK